MEEKEKEAVRWEDVVGGGNKFFLKACQWVLDEMPKENDCCVTRGTFYSLAPHTPAVR